MIEVKSPKKKKKKKGKKGSGSRSWASSPGKKGKKGKKKKKVVLPTHPDGSINYGRPKTTDFGRRKIEMLRWFHGRLIGANDNKMDYISNVFVS